MSGLTTALADEMLNLFRNTAATQFTPYIALFNGDPAGAGTELTTTITGSATRNACGFSAPQAGTGTQRKIVNGSDIDITASASGSATADYYAIYDAATAGNLKFSKALTSSLTINAGSPVSIAAGDLEIYNNYND